MPEPGPPADPQHFADRARHYCQLIESHQDHELALFLGQVRAALVELYQAALLLPATGPAGADCPEDVSPEEGQALARALRARLAALDSYATVVDPYARTEETPGRGSVADDLTAIYRDLRRGLSCWGSGSRAGAVGEWRFHFAHHWGQHLTGALRALHAATYSHGWAPRPPQADA